MAEEINITGLDMIKHLEDEEQTAEVTGLEFIKSDESFSITGLETIRHIIETDLPPVSEFAVELLRLASTAKELDYEFSVHGSQVHKYEFAPVVLSSVINDFEYRHNIRLPKAYREFLTQVGNGGAGPDNGLFPLDMLEFHNYYVHSGSNIHLSEAIEQPDYFTMPYKIDDKPVIINSELTDMQWNDLCNELHSLRTKGNYEEYVKKRHEIYNGVIHINSSIDNCGILLICDGDMSGEVIEMTGDLGRPNFLGISFEEWILGYFKSVIRRAEHNK